MSLPDLSSSRKTSNCILIALALVAGVAISGCQVRPLYSQTSAGTGVGEQARLASVAINDVDTRYAQEVRNHLIFLLGGGAGEPASPAYRVTMTVTSETTSAAQVQSADTTRREGQPTAGTVQLSAVYSIMDAATTKPVANGFRTVYSSFDRPRQPYAELRAERDAQDRAARELAQQLHLAIAQNLSKL
ncbi:MAG: LPS assembly lipoprotein LptE [Phyllobacterium sp.]